MASANTKVQMHIRKRTRSTTRAVCIQKRTSRGVNVEPQAASPTESNMQFNIWIVVLCVEQKTVNRRFRLLPDSDFLISHRPAAFGRAKWNPISSLKCSHSLNGIRAYRKRNDAKTNRICNFCSGRESHSMSLDFSASSKFNSFSPFSAYLLCCEIQRLTRFGQN